MVLAWGSLYAQGLHIHDDGKAAAAKDAKTAFDDLTKGDQDTFSVMIANVRAIEQKTLDELYALNQQNVRDRVTRIPAQKWGDLTCDLHDREAEFLQAYQASVTALNLNPASARNAKEALKQASDALAAKKKELAAKKKELNDKLPPVKDLREAIDNVRTAISFQPKPVRNLKDLEQFKSLEKAFDGVKGVHDWIVEIDKTKGGPGLQLSMLDLSYQLQQGEVDRLQLEVDGLAEEEAYAERVHDLLVAVVGNGDTIADRLIDNSGRPDRERLRGGEFGVMYGQFIPRVRPGTDNFCRPSYDPQKDQSPVVIETVGDLAQKAKAEVGIAPEQTVALTGGLLALSMNVAVAGYQKYLLMGAMIEHITNEQVLSLEREALNARMRATLISHGIEGLNSYHQGGITGADVANVISAAQTIAAGIIAGRLN